MSDNDSQEYYSTRQVKINKGENMSRKWKKGDVYDNATHLHQLDGESLFVVRHDCESRHFGTYLGNLDNIKELRNNIILFAKDFERLFSGSKYGVKIEDIDSILDRARHDLQRLDSYKIWTPEADKNNK